MPKTMGKEPRAMTRPPMKPEESPEPVGSLQAVINAGLDPAVVCACAVPDPKGTNGRVIRGCPHGEKCAEHIFGNEELGGFGPDSLAPGTPGKKPSNVGTYHEDSRTGRVYETFMKCTVFMTAWFDKYRQQVKSGDLIEIVAQEGEPITIVDTLPEEPGTCNKNGNARMVEVEKTINVPVLLDLPSREDRMGHVQKIRDARRKLVRQRRLERVSRLDQGDAVSEPADAKP